MNEIRYLTNDDLLSYKRLASICYTYADAEQPRACTEEELHQRVGVFGEDGTLLSAMIHNRYLARFEGRDVPLVGIGGVVTDPAARGQGSVRRLFETYLPKLREEGYVFSALYPFSHVFYRKFGYELAFERKAAELHPGDLRKDLARADEIVRVLPDQDDQGMRRVYDEYIAEKDFAIRRDEAMWRDVRQGTPWEKMKYAYVLKRRGEAVAYWIGAAQKRDGEATLSIDDMAYTCREGLESIFAMLRGMNEIATIRLSVPAEVDPRWLVGDPYDVSFRDVSCGGMLRVVDAEKALTMLKPPCFAGKCVIAVSDNQIADNNGTFAVVGDGRTVTVTRRDGEDADLRCSIGGLSALMGGLQDFGDAILAGHAEVLDDTRLPYMTSLFRRRKTYLNWHF